jgi:subfamily B ATP-binding cassette protein MsbA
LRPHKRALAFALLAVIGETAADLLQPWMLKIVLDGVLRSKPMQGAGWFNHFVLRVAGTGQLSLLRFAVIGSLVIAVFGAACSYAEKYLTTSVGQRVLHDMRMSLYAHVQRLSLSYHDNSRTGDLISRVTSDIDNVQSFVASGVLSAIVDVLTLAGMVGVMFYVNWKFTLAALSVVPILAVVVYSYTRRIKKAAREVRKKEGEIVSTVQEVLGSIRVVKAFAREDYEERRLEEESLESIEIALRARSLKAKLAPLVEVIVAIGTSIVLWMGARMVMAGRFNPGTLVVFILYLGKMFKPIQDLSKMTDSYSKAAVGLERIREVLAAHGEVADTPGARTVSKVRGQVEFADVHFHYEGGPPILRGVTLRIEPGQTAALVGPTGAGKTTIVSLIPRFYDPTSGVVRLDGTDVRRFTKKSLRENISFVLQDTALFHGSIWSNISYGKPGASRREIYAAAELANAHEFIEKLPEGYNTIIGERGVTLSGGQRQRVAIARAVIRNSPLLILDEPSSGLDAESEHLVFEALERLMKGRTSIVIAHRLSTIRDADAIFVVDNGAISESGTHDELLKSGGLYAKLYQLIVPEESELTGR